MTHRRPCLLALLSFVALVVSCAPASAQTETVIHAFDSTDGAWSLAPLIYDKASNAFYGTTFIGGATNNGTVFELSKDSSGNWVETVLYSFLGIVSNDCSNPNSSLAVTKKNGQIAAFYGTCDFGGEYNYGVVFGLNAQSDGTWKERVIHSFNYPTDGGNPRGGVVMDQAGSLYGTTNIGGANLGGTIYRLTRNQGGWTKSTLYDFPLASFPEARLVFDKSGALYGTTSNGGPNFSGTVFQLAPGSGGTWIYNLLYTFTGQNGEGSDPRGALIIDGKGSLYGNTASGGTAGLGTVFRLDPPVSGQTDWTETQLYLFSDVSDGASPVGGLTFGGPGVLYGTTSAGGTLFGGTAFQLSWNSSGSWNKTLLWTFGATNDGTMPWATLLLKEGTLLGTTQFGGTYSEGIIFQITP